MTIETFAENLRTARKARSLSQAQLDEKLGLYPSSIMSYENNRISPNVFIFIKLCEALDISPNDLLGYHPASD